MQDCYIWSCGAAPACILGLLSDISVVLSSLTMVTMRRDAMLPNATDHTVTLKSNVCQKTIQNSCSKTSTSTLTFVEIMTPEEKYTRFGTEILILVLISYFPTPSLLFLILTSTSVSSKWFISRGIYTISVTEAYRNLQTRPEHK